MQAPDLQTASAKTHGLTDPRNLRADDLRYLLAVANTGRLVAAADALGVDHSTVSRRLKSLERTLGVRLIERGVDGWELTETGRTVAERARPIEDALERVTLALAGTHDDSLAARLSACRISAALRRAGRSRGVDQTAAEITTDLLKPQVRQPF